MWRVFALGFALGILSAFGFLELGVPGLAILLIGIIWSLRYPWALSSVSGLLVGIGATVLVLITAPNARCAGANQSGPGFESSCTAPDSSLLLTLAAVAVAVGLAIAAAIAVRAKRPVASSPD
jgi:hypothetical protein